MNDNIILDPAERDYAELKSGIDALLESTKRAIREQERIARQADAAVLDKPESFKNA